MRKRGIRLDLGQLRLYAALSGSWQLDIGIGFDYVIEVDVLFDELLDSI